MKNNFSLFFLCSLSLLGCSAPLDSSLRYGLSQGVSIDQTITMPDKAAYFGPKKVTCGLWSAPFGIDECDIIKSYVNENKIDLPKIVRDEFMMQLEQRDSSLKGHISANGQLMLHLEIQLYGIAQKTAFSSDYKPLLNIVARLTDRSGNQLWKSMYSVTNLNDETPTSDYYDYFKDPSAFTTAFESAAKVAITELMTDLR